MSTLTRKLWWFPYLIMKIMENGWGFWRDGAQIRINRHHQHQSTTCIRIIGVYLCVYALFYQMSMWLDRCHFPRISTLVDWVELAYTKHFIRVCVCVFEIFPNITWMLSFDAALRHIDNTNFVWNWFDSIFNLFRSNTLISTCQSNARDLVPFLVSILHSTRHKMNRKCGRRNKTRFVV